MGFADIARDNVVWFIRAVSSLYVVYHYGGFISQVDGPSMFPTFAGKGDLVIAESLPFVTERVGVGDIVICTRPIKADENIIKRVAAVAGDTVSVFTPGCQAPTLIQVPRGHVWLQGDNLVLSRDSREYGAVPLALLKGRVVAQVWPKVRRLQRRPPSVLP